MGAGWLAGAAEQSRAEQKVKFSDVVVTVIPFPGNIEETAGQIGRGLNFQASQSPRSSRPARRPPAPRQPKSVRELWCESSGRGN